MAKFEVEKTWNHTRKNETVGTKTFNSFKALLSYLERVAVWNRSAFSKTRQIERVRCFLSEDNGHAQVEGDNCWYYIRKI